VKLTIYNKMMIGFTIIILILTIGNAYMLFELYAVSDKTKVTLTSNVQAIDLAKQLQTLFYEEEAYAQKFLIAYDDVYYAMLDERTRRFNEDMDSLTAIPFAQEELDLLANVQRVHNGFADGLARRRFAPGTSTETDIRTPVRLDSARTMLDRFIRINQSSIDAAMATVENTTQSSVNVALLLTLGTLLIAVTLALIITRTITRPLGHVIRSTEQIARGTFDPIRVTSNDEIASLADAVNDMSEKLKKINEYKADLMYQISHELRTPLQTILSAQFLLAEQRLGPLNMEQQKLLGSIRGSVDKLMKFTNQFLDLAKVEAGMMEFRLLPCNIVSIVTSAMEEVRLLAAQRQIIVNLATTPVPHAMADSEKLSQVFGNLLSNAVKYTDKGGMIHVSIVRARNKLLVSVRDTGVGIPQIDLSRVFTKFYQASNVSRSGSKGTGLGLALVKAFVEGHGGRVFATSTVGAGSTFTVELPIPETLQTPIRGVDVSATPSVLHG